MELYSKYEDRVEIHGPFIMKKTKEGGIPMAGRKAKFTAVM